MPSTTLGARIRALRERAGIQSQDLAAAVGLDPSAMSNIERGKRSVKTDELTRIASGLGVSTLALLDESSLLARLPVAPRAMDGAAVDGPALQRLTGLAELHVLLVESGIKAPTAPDIDTPLTNSAHWKDSANQLATWTLDRLGPLECGDARFGSLVEAIEKAFAIDVLVESHPEDAVSGAALTDPDFPLIYVNGSYPQTRCLFTLAHELGHILTGAGEPLSLDTNLAASNDWERQANAFAASLLMPAATVIRRVNDAERVVDALANLIEEFGVSFDSMLYRLQTLKLITAKGRKDWAARGWREALGELSDQDQATRLLNRLGRRPVRHAPSFLTFRAYKGFVDGATSVRPLASLIDLDASDLLHRLSNTSDSPGTAHAASTDVASEPNEDVADDEAYAGEPV